MILIEWYKQVRRRRTYLALGIVAAFSVALTVALSTTGAGQTEFVGDLPLLMVPRSSGLSVPVIALSSTMKFLLPLAVSVFAGEAVAGEAGWGSLRYVLARPVSRARVLWSKAAVAGALSLAAVLILAVVAFVVGGLAFGWHPLRVIDGSSSTPGHPASVVVPASSALGHLGVAVLYVGAGMTSIFAVAFFLSTTTKRPLVAVAGGVALTVVSRIFNADYFPGIAVVNRYMPNNDIDLWQHLFTPSPDLSAVPHFLVLQLVYVAVFMSLAHWWFMRKDVFDSIGIELAKQVRRPGYWTVLAVMSAISVVVTLIIALTSATTPERLGDFGSVIPNSSGLTMAPITLNSLLLFLLPLSTAIYAGEAVAGDASWGSLRYSLARPVTRQRVLASKVTVAGLFSLAAVAVVSVTGVVAGLVAFGWHPLNVIDLQHASPFANGLSTFAPLEALGRIGLATAVVAGTMASTFAFAILCSTLTDRPFAAVAGGVLLSFVSRSLDNIPGLHALGPWLPMTNYGAGLWTQVLFQPADLGGYPHLALVQAGYTAVFLAAAWAWFNRKDVLS